MVDSVFDNHRRRPSRVAAALTAQRIEELRQETAEAKLLRAFQLYEIGRELQGVRKNARSTHKRRSTNEVNSRPFFTGPQDPQVKRPR
ncbi:MAG: hypothetical protein HPY71_06535 [Firmicutes bacterium]|nr:hypothetical protein [Bacillota bacterium]